MQGYVVNHRGPIALYPPIHYRAYPKYIDASTVCVDRPKLQTYSDRRIVQQSVQHSLKRTTDAD